MQGAHVIGRDFELLALAEFLGASGPRAFVVSGRPGIGKTTVWSAALGVAAERGLRVLSARPSGAEAQLSFTALIDLCDGIELGELDGVPAPQRSALEVALLRADPTGVPPEPRAIALGVLNVLRALAASGPLVIAIDDIQWLDAASADTLAFAARRLERESTGFLLAKRPGRATAIERAFEHRTVERLELGPLSLGATRRILAERLDLTLPRQALRRIVDSAVGNPLFALELGRTLVERGPLAAGEEIPVPDALEDMLGTRVGKLPEPVRRLLLAVALSGGLRTGELAAIAAPGALDDALDAALLVVDGDRVRASHPLLAAAARKRSRARERRELHHALADAVEDAELRALHLALATDRPDEALAATISAAAAAASARGGREQAVRLAEHALRLTPEGSPERSERLLALGAGLELAGELQRLTDVVTPALEWLPAGPTRARLDAAVRGRRGPDQPGLRAPPRPGLGGVPQRSGAARPDPGQAVDRRQRGHDRPPPEGRGLGGGRHGRGARGRAPRAAARAGGAGLGSRHDRPLARRRVRAPPGHLARGPLPRRVAQAGRRAAARLAR